MPNSDGFFNAQNGLLLEEAWQHCSSDTIKESSADQLIERKKKTTNRRGNFLIVLIVDK